MVSKIDACKYFDSISHDVLLRQQSRLFKDPQLLVYFRNLLDTYSVSPGRGLPIGNLTSQYFANHYLAVADHFLKEQLRLPAMLRYMDDVLMFENSLQELRFAIDCYRRYLSEELQLEIHPPVVNRTKFGVPFLGYVVYGHGLRLNRRSKLRFDSKLEELTSKQKSGAIGEQEYASRVTCLMAFVRKASTEGLRRHIMNNGMYLQGL